jgi:hypothetical protein
MTDATTGYAVWPSGVRWIVLSTHDGWRSVVNRTPVAVPTDGGLVLAAQVGRVAVGVLPYQQLTVSPVLSSDGTTRTWTPSQLPSALAATSTALARSASATWAVLGDGRVLTSADATPTWVVTTSARQLDASGAITVTGVGFPDGATGFLTAARTGSGPSLFVTQDDGASWADTGLRADGQTVSTWLPCLVGSMWAAAAQVDDHLELLTAPSATGPWTANGTVPAPGRTLVSCTPGGLLAAVPTGDSEQLYTASRGRSWSPAGVLDGRLLSLTAVSDREAFATDADHSAMLHVSLGGSVRVTRIAMPEWVATIGGPSMRS